MKEVRKILSFFIILLMGWGFTSCVEDDYAGSTIDPKKAVTFKFTMPQSLVNTRGVAAISGENKINNLTLLFFKPTQNGTGEYVGYYKVPEEQLPVNGEMDFDLKIEFDDQELKKSEAYSILALANMVDYYWEDLESDFDDFIDGLKSGVIKTENEVVNLVIMSTESVIGDRNYSDTPIEHNNIPMGGRGSKAKEDELVAMKLIRAVSRFDVINEADGYTLETVSIWNASVDGALWDGVSLENRLYTKRYCGLGNVDPDDNEVVGIKNQSLIGGLYAFENISANPELNDEKTTCLILGFRKDNNPLMYYRLNIHSNDRGQYLKRNNVYKVTVQSVKGDGENSEEEAYTQGEFLLDVSINAWDRDEDGLIIRSGDNLLAIPTRKAVFSPKAEERQYYVYTQGVGKLELEILEMPVGMSARLEGNNLWINVQAYDLDQRKGSIELKFAGMSGIIEIVQSGKTEKFLTLSHTQIPVYPAGLINGNMFTASPVKVNSSGPWTAEIYIADYFSFDNATMLQRKIHPNRPPGEEINAIFCIKANEGKESRTAFVLISLDDDPENYRNVLILTQAGSGAFGINPDVAQVDFRPNGQLAQNNKNKFDIAVGSSDNWEAKFVGVGDQDKFKLIANNATQNGDHSVTGMGAEGGFTVEAIGENMSDKEYTASLEITQNNAVKKNIKIVQAKYDLIVSLRSSNSTIASDGSTTVEYGITSTTTSGMDWTATIEGGLFKTNDGNVETISGIVGQAGSSSFKVTMPGISKHLAPTDLPKAVVTVSLAGTSVKKEVIVEQDPVKYVELKAQSINNGIGTWANQREWFAEWLDVMMSGANFGPTGKVYATRAGIEVPTTYSANGLSDNNTRFINAARVTAGNVTTAGTKFSSAMQTNKHLVAFITEYSDSYLTRGFTVLGASGYTVGSGGISASTPRKITGDSQITSTEIYKYIFKNGPFGEVTASNIVLHGYDAANTTLSGWPDTFIPLMFYSNGDVIFGIDPTNRIIYAADSEMFSRQTGTYSRYNYADDKEDNKKFIRNVIAWMVEVANYGEPFLERFKNDKCR